MIRFLLLRDKPGPDRTFGVLMHGTLLIAQTMEPGDADTAFPRVKPGFYALVPHGWGNEPVKWKRTWALVGDGVSHQPEPGVPRSAVLIHTGNWDEETRGCILVGKTRGTLNGEPALIGSRAAMDSVRERIGGAYYAGLIIQGG